MISEKLKEVARHVANRSNCGTVGSTMALPQAYLSRNRPSGAQRSSGPRVQNNFFKKVIRIYLVHVFKISIFSFFENTWVKKCEKYV